MANTINTIIIKHGTSAPKDADLLANELGFDEKNKQLYIGTNGNPVKIGLKNLIDGEYTAQSGQETIIHGSGSLRMINTMNDNGPNAFAEGYKTTAHGSNSHAEGRDCQAKGTNSHAEGGRPSDETPPQPIPPDWSPTGNEMTLKGSEAHGDCSHAEGQQTLAYGLASHSEGYGSIAYDESSHAEGYSALAKGKRSHAEGCQTHAYGENSHAEGFKTKAFGANSHAEGYNTQAQYDYQHIQGKYGTTSTDAAFVIGWGDVNNGNKNVFSVKNNGQTSSYSATTLGADYAEYFEWEDKNLYNEDRVGRIVTLNKDKINLAKDSDETLGIISGTASVIGDNPEWNWQGRFEKDKFGRPIYEEIINEFGKKELVQKTSPDYDPSKEYTRRKDRPEWDAVGLLGKLHALDDGTCVPGKYAKASRDGIATLSEEKTNMYVMKRIAEDVVLVMLK